MKCLTAFAVNSLLLCSANLLGAKALAADLQLLFGPPSVGQGGSNPLSFPPSNPIEWQLTLVTDEQREWLVSVVPGLLYGYRFKVNGFYAALGGGLLLTTTGLGLGLDHAYGYESQYVFQRFRYLVEYRQIFGIARYGLQFPYTVRIGMSYAI